MRHRMLGGIRRAMAAIAQKTPFKLRHRLGGDDPDTYDSDSWRFDCGDRGAHVNAHELVKPMVAGDVVAVIM